MSYTRWRWSLVLATVATAVLITVYGCGPLYQIAGYPPEVRRTTPPPKIAERVLDTRTQPPALEAASTQGTWKLDERRINVLVFYRGHW
jgi:hypothetical protein